MPELVYFPTEILELQKEVLLHPPLMEELNKAKGNPSLEEKVAFIAAYCDIPVHEVFSPEGFRMFCDMLTMALRGKRTGMVVSTAVQ